MKELKPVLIRDNKQSIIIFCMMFVALFMIVAPVSLYVKEAVWGLGTLIFLVSLSILVIVRSTNRTLPRFIEIKEDLLNFIYWNGDKKTVSLKEIESVIVDGHVGKSITTTISVKTKQDTIKIWIEVFDTTRDLINFLNNKVEITYKDKNHERVVKENLNPNPWRKRFRTVFAYFWVAIFWAMAVAINLNLPSMVH